MDEIMDTEVKFSPNQRLPYGYRVYVPFRTGGYMAEKIDGTWKLDVPVLDRFQARRLCIAHHNKGKKEE